MTNSIRQNAIERHDAAMRRPNAIESPFVLMLHGIEEYVDEMEMRTMRPGVKGSWRDYVIGPHAGAMLHAFVGLLNGPHGNLDPGTLDAWARKMAERIGYDMDAGEMAGNAPAYYEIQPSDVGKPRIEAFGRKWPVEDFLGTVRRIDVGKRVYRRGDHLTVENDGQLRARRARESA